MKVSPLGNKRSSKGELPNHVITPRATSTWLTITHMQVSEIGCVQFVGILEEPIDLQDLVAYWSSNEKTSQFHFCEAKVRLDKWIQGSHHVTLDSRAQSKDFCVGKKIQLQKINRT